MNQTFLTPEPHMYPLKQWNPRDSDMTGQDEAETSGLLKSFSSASVQSELETLNLNAMLHKYKHRFRESIPYLGLPRWSEMVQATHSSTLAWKIP